MLDRHASIRLPAVEVPDVAVVGGEISDGEALRLRAGVDAAAWLCTLCIEVGEGEGDLVGELLVAGDALNVQLVLALGKEAVGALVMRIDPRALHSSFHLLHHIGAAGIHSGFHLCRSMDPTTGARAFHSTRCGSQEGEDSARSHDARQRMAEGTRAFAVGAF